MDYILKWLENLDLYKKLDESYNEILVLDVNLSNIVPFTALFLGLIILVVSLILVVVTLLIFPKKRCINYFTGYVHSTKIYTRRGFRIKYPQLEIPNKYHFVGWYREKEFIHKYSEEIFKEKKDLNLFAKFNVD